MQALNQLLSIMGEQVKVMCDLAAVGKNKSRVLVDGNIHDLDILLRGEQSLIWQMGQLEEKRFKLQVEIASQMEIHPSLLTLDRLLRDAAPEYAARCHSMAEQYGHAAGELAQVNELNTALTQQAMAYMDFSLQLLGGRAQTGQVYSARGPKQGGAGAKLRRLDNRM